MSEGVFVGSSNQPSQQSHPTWSVPMIRIFKIEDSSSHFSDFRICFSSSEANLRHVFFSTRCLSVEFYFFNFHYDDEIVRDEYIFFAIMKIISFKRLRIFDFPTFNISLYCFTNQAYFKLFSIYQSIYKSVFILRRLFFRINVPSICILFKYGLHITQ